MSHNTRKLPAHPTASALPRDAEDTGIADTSAPSTASAPPRPDFDPERLRLSQDFPGQVGVKKALRNVPVRKPDKQSFVRVHPDEAWSFPAMVINLKEDREIYIVDRSLWEALQGELVPTMLFTAITRQGVLFIWPVRLPGVDGRRDNWSSSALDAATDARRGWVRVVSNMHLGAYEVWEATAEYPDPEWPAMEFSALLELAFRDTYIRTLDHPVVRRLRGNS